MLDLLKKMANRTYTENGAATYESTESFCLDLFAAAGALREASDEDIITRFIKAYAEDPDIAMKILFYARDIRCGLGERRVFRVIMEYLAVNEPASVRKNIGRIASYGRFDDILSLIGTPCEDACMDYIRDTLSDDIRRAGEGKDVSLLAKWLPSVNTSNAEAVRKGRKTARALGMTLEEYRKTLTMLRARIRIIENDLREKDYSFEYRKLPSCALFRYRMAFIRHDRDRYFSFLKQAEKAPSVMHTGTLTPYSIIQPVVNCFDRGRDITEEERKAMDTTWNALEDYAGSDNTLVVVDGSGSMYWGSKALPAAVAQSLGIYFAERNRGMFRGHFITFSSHPRLIEIKGKDIVGKVRYCMSFNECSNTDIEKTFALILETAVKNRLNQSQMPDRLIIISDMEFDCCARNSGMTNLENARAEFARYGYHLPRLVFWNVNSRNTQQPVTRNEQGVVLVSGMSPQVFGMIKNDDLDPYRFMMNIISSERYAQICA